MSIIEKAINKLEREKGKDALVGNSTKLPINSSARRDSESYQDRVGSPDTTIISAYQREPVSDPGLDEHVAASLETFRPDEKTTYEESDSELHENTESDCLVPRPIHEIPFKSLAELGMITPQKPRSRIADEYRTIKRPLLLNIENRGASTIENPNLIMVTSALPGEGKTFTAVNLALSMATEQDRTVLLVDADVTKASAAAMLEIDDDSAGLIDLLEDSSRRFSDVLIQTSIPKFRVLPAGHLHEHATELLASENMRRLMKELSRRYPDRVIIFDSPPLLMTTESSVLANLVGQVVFVVAAESSSYAAVEEAIEHLGEDKAVGLVLNKARQNPLLSHGYGYGYGYGYGEGVRKARKASKHDDV